MKFNLKLFLIRVVSSVFAYAAGVWALVEDNLFAAAFYCCGGVVFSVYAIWYGRQYLIRGDGDESDHTIGKTPHRRLVVVLWRAFWGLALAVVVVSLVRRVVTGAPPYYVLGGLWIMTYIGANLLFTSLF